jgi:release factor glutamine methyltransferase
LALEGNYQVTATEISEEALKIAVTNAVSSPLPDGHGLETPALAPGLSFAQMDLLSAISDNSLDAVVSNPPYVPIADAATLQREVRDWEPHLALFAGNTGLDIYHRLIPEAHRVLRPGGLLALEFGFGQTDALIALLATWDNLEILPDLAVIPRVLLCKNRA